MTQIQRDLDQNLATFERVLNIPGYIPGVATVSAPFRAAYGKILIIGALFTAAITTLIKLKDSRSNTESQRIISEGITLFTNYALHGVVNIGRAFLEATSILGLCLCLPYDLSGHRFSYPYERPTTHPFSFLRPT
jgi:hypothetical protein